MEQNTTSFSEKSEEKKREAEDSKVAQFSPLRYLKLEQSMGKIFGQIRNASADIAAGNLFFDTFDRRFAPK
jgi:hypothetical protein